MTVIPSVPAAGTPDVFRTTGPLRSPACVSLGHVKGDVMEDDEFEATPPTLKETQDTADEASEQETSEEYRFHDWALI